MNCPKCKSTRVGVMDIVNNDSADEMYRKVKCTACGKIFYTVEFEVDCTKAFAKEWNEHRNSGGDEV